MVTIRLETLGDQATEIVGEGAERDVLAFVADGKEVARYRRVSTAEEALRAAPGIRPPLAQSRVPLIDLVGPLVGTGEGTPGSQIIVEERNRDW